MKIDMPTGRTDHLPSGITGRTISYFTPDPLPELLSRCAENKLKKNKNYSTPFSELLLLRSVAKSTNNVVDLKQAMHFLSIMTEPPKHRIEDLMSLGRSLSKKITGLRDEIIFAGAKVPSSARHVYAPHAALPGLFNSLEDGLTKFPLKTIDPLHVAAITGMFCACMHPFIDANGRWSRLIAFSAGKCAEDNNMWRSLAAVTFMNSCKSLLCNKIWQDARTEGMREYLELTNKFESRLLKSLHEIDAFQVVTQFADAILPRQVGPKRGLHLLSGAIATGALPLSALRSWFGLSQRSAEGRLRKAAERVHGASVVAQTLDLSAFITQIDDVVSKTVTETVNMIIKQGGSQ